MFEVLTAKSKAPKAKQPVAESILTSFVNPTVSSVMKLRLDLGLTQQKAAEFCGLKKGAALWRVYEGADTQDTNARSRLDWYRYTAMQLLGCVHPTCALIVKPVDDVHSAQLHSFEQSNSTVMNFLGSLTSPAGIQIRTARENAGLTQEQMRLISGTAYQSTYAQLENGSRMNKSWKNNEPISDSVPTSMPVRMDPVRWFVVELSLGINAFYEVRLRTNISEHLSISCFLPGGSYGTRSSDAEHQRPLSHLHDAVTGNDDWVDGGHTGGLSLPVPLLKGTSSGNRDLTPLQLEAVELILDEMRKHGITLDMVRAASSRRTPGMRNVQLTPEVREICMQIHETMVDAKVTFVDLGSDLRSGFVKPKYKDPKTGRTWTGRGHTPGWIVEYLNEAKVPYNTWNGKGKIPMSLRDYLIPLKV